MGNIAERNVDRVRAWRRLVRSISGHPILFVGMIFYWLWINMGFQIPVVFLPIKLSSGMVIPSQVGPLLASVVAYLIISFSFRRTRKVFPQTSFLWVICITMSLASALIVLWLDFTMVPAQGSNAISFSDSVPYVLSITVYLLGCALFGTSSAFLCIEMQRIYGSLGSQHVLFHGSVAMLASVLIILLLSFTPLLVQQLVFMAAPLPIAYCLQRSRKDFSKKELFQRGLEAKLYIPYKLLVTSCLHGLSLGVLLSYPIMQSGGTTLLLCTVLSYALAALALLVSAISAKLNFNNLIYQIGFPLIAVGLYLTIVFTDMPLIGVTVQLLGFCYLHLVMWGVCAYFIKNFNMPSTWVIGIATCLFMTGQLIGAIASGLISQAPDTSVWVVRLSATVLLIILSASLFMMSNKNLRTGWGLAQADAIESQTQPNREFTIRTVASDANLTKRETAILEYLARGKNRKAISAELVVSDETVKSHIQNIYKKVGVHSQQELLSLLDQKESQTEDYASLEEE